MRVLGIDPGSQVTGFGIIEEKKGEIIVLDQGVIRLKKIKDFPYRLKYIYDKLQALLLKFNPQVIVLETLFFAKNVKSVLKLGEVRGLILFAAANSGIEIAEYSPLEIKQAVVGYGRASKEQILIMVQRLLKIPEEILPYDTADALAAAICHLHTAKMNKFI